MPLTRRIRDQLLDDPFPQWSSDDGGLLRPAHHHNDGFTEPWNPWQAHIAASEPSTGFHWPTMADGQGDLGAQGSDGHDPFLNAPPRGSHELDSRSPSLAGSATGVTPWNTGLQAGFGSDVGEDVPLEDEDWAIQSMDGIDERISARDLRIGTSPNHTMAKPRVSSRHQALPSQDPGLPISNQFLSAASNAALAAAGFVFDDDPAVAKRSKVSRADQQMSLDIPIQPPHPAGMTIPPSSSHFQENLPSSWPPSRETFPPYFDTSIMSTIGHVKDSNDSRETRKRGVAIPHTQIIFPQSDETTLPIRSAGRRGSAKKSRSDSMSENKTTVVPNRGLARKGGRTGKLPNTQAPIVAQKRHDRSVCIWCRLRRVTVGFYATYLLTLRTKKGSVLVPIRNPLANGV